MEVVLEDAGWDTTFGASVFVSSFSLRISLEVDEVELFLVISEMFLSEIVFIKRY